MDEKTDKGEEQVEANVVAEERNAAQADASSADSAASEDDRTGSRKGVWLMLIVLVAGAGFLVLNADRLQQLVPSRSSPAPEPVSRPAAPKPEARPAAAPEKIQRPQPVQTVPKLPKNIATHAEVQAMLDAADGLKQELQLFAREQQLIRQTLEEQRRMNLRLRLRWITDPAARLPQIRLAWEEISLMPGLSEEQRTQAASMHQLAGSVAERLRGWRSAIARWADTLQVPSHRDILPKPEHPWLAWIVGQFHLRQAPSVEARRLSGLRQRLLDVDRMLMLEQWPDAADWQRLRAELLLELDRHPHEGTVDLGLPEDFREVSQDIETLRHVARQWQERL